MTICSNKGQKNNAWDDGTCRNKYIETCTYINEIILSEFWV